MSVSRPGSPATPPRAGGIGGGKLLYIEAVRGLASIIVLLHHIVTAESSVVADWTHAYVDPGRVGVVAFFIVSGYVIPLSLDRQALAVFVRRRAFRLFPVYWVVLGAFLLLAPLVARPDEAVSGPLVLIANVFMVQGLLPLATVVPTAWTLGIELVFYVQQALLRARGALSRPGATAAFWLSAFVMVQGLRAVTGSALPVTVFALLFTASLGHALYLRDSRGDTSWRWITAAAVVVVPLATCVGGDVDPTWPPFPYITSYVLGIAFFFALRAARGLFEVRVLGRLAVAGGAVSYALYLVHPLVYRLVALTGLSSTWVVLVSCLASVAVSAIVHEVVEKPGIALGRRQSRRRG